MPASELPMALRGGWAFCETDAQFTAWLRERMKYSWGTFSNTPLASMSLGSFEERRWHKKADPVPPAPTYSRLPA